MTTLCLFICRKLLIREEFIPEVETALKDTPNLVVCISEGIRDKNGTFICEYSSEVGTDTFGHKMLTGSGKYLENLVKNALASFAPSSSMSASVVPALTYPELTWTNPKTQVFTLY